MKDINENELNEYKLINLNEEFIERYEDCLNVGDTINATMHKHNDDRYSIVIYFDYADDGEYVPDYECFIDKNDVEFIKHIQIVADEYKSVK